MTLGKVPSFSGLHLPPRYIAEVEMDELRAPSSSGFGSWLHRAGLVGGI